MGRLKKVYLLEEVTFFILGGITVGRRITKGLKNSLFQKIVG
jgi:hypothetical protein